MILLRILRRALQLLVRELFMRELFMPEKLRFSR